jgi:scyllo-inositol 2-dehydrogenase (NADP+)
LLLHYAGGTRALLRATMLAATPRPRFIVFGEKGSFLKRDFDPLEPTLRLGDIPKPGDSWMLEREENWGELTNAEGDARTTRRVPSVGDWRDFYANVRDVILGQAHPQVTLQQALDVMQALKLAQESHEKSVTVLWQRIQV